MFVFPTDIENANIEHPTLNIQHREKKMRSLLILMLFLFSGLLPTGCGPKTQDLTAKAMRPPPRPPRYAKAKPEPLDMALREEAKRAIFTAARSGQVEQRVHALEAIQDANLPEGQAEILDGLRDPEPVVRFASAVAAGELRLADAKPILIDIAYDKSGSVRAAVRFALHRLGDTRLSHDFETLTQNPLPHVRANTAMLLGLLGEPSAVKILRPMRQDRDDSVRMQVSEAMWRLGDPVGRDDLIALSVSAHPDDQMIGLLALAEPRDQRVGKYIFGALATEDRDGKPSGYPESALVAARALGMLDSDEGYGVAVNGAASGDPRQRQLAAFAFGAIGRSDAQSYLRALLHDSNQDVRIAAATAIFQLKAPAI